MQKRLARSDNPLRLSWLVGIEVSHHDNRKGLSLRGARHPDSSNEPGQGGRRKG